MSVAEFYETVANLPPCDMPRCTEWMAHEHGIDPEYPTVHAQYRTPDQLADALANGGRVVKGGPWQR